VTQTEGEQTKSKNTEMINRTVQYLWERCPRGCGRDAYKQVVGACSVKVLTDAECDLLHKGYVPNCSEESMKDPEPSALGERCVHTEETLIEDEDIYW
jgi:hypothetical protein